MKKTTLLFLVRPQEILLAMKKRGFGAGKWNGCGGKLHEGESFEACVVREAQEEIGCCIKSEDLRLVAILHFDFEGRGEWNQESRVFFAQHWSGEPTESEEMAPQWYPNNALPFSKMWVDDPYWLPRVVAGERLQARFLFGEEGATLLSHDISVLAS